MGPGAVAGGHRSFCRLRAGEEYFRAAQSFGGGGEARGAQGRGLYGQDERVPVHDGLLRTGAALLRRSWDVCVRLCGYLWEVGV